MANVGLKILGNEIHEVNSIQLDILAMWQLEMQSAGKELPKGRGG